MLTIVAGAFIGLLIGAMIGHDMWLIGALAGGLLVHLAGSRQARERDLHERLARMERNIAELRGQLDSLRGHERQKPEETTVAGAMEERLSPPGQPAVLEDAAADAAPEKGPREALPAAPERVAPAGSVDLEMPQWTKRISTTNGGDALGHLDKLEMPEWARKFWAANPLAKIGIILLFFGVASGLRLAIDHGLLPVPVRLIVTAAGSLGLIAFGMIKARESRHHTFGLALQGGGFALLYLVGYFMLDRYR